MALIKAAYALRCILVKLFLPRDSLAGCFPHAGDVDILTAVVIEVGPGATHPSPDAFDVRLFRSDRERSVAIVAIKLGGTEIIGDKKVRQAIAFESPQAHAKL
jgi:hypothetical protein